jgi:hypothetical protein
MGASISSVRIRRRRSGTKPPKSVLSAMRRLTCEKRLPLRGLRSAVNQFTTKGYAQELSIRYVAGPRNQRILSFQQVLYTATIRIDNS